MLLSKFGFFDSTNYILILNRLVKKTEKLGPLHIPVGAQMHCLDKAEIVNKMFKDTALFKVIGGIFETKGRNQC